MNNSEFVHQHLDEDQLDDIAREVIDGTGEAPSQADCAHCQEQIELHARCLQLARLLTHDTRVPAGTPAVDAVRAIRRKSYPRRALAEIAALLSSPPLKERV